MRIRPFVETDYPAYSELWKAVFPDEAFSAGELRSFDDAVREPKYGLRQIVAETAGSGALGGYGVSSCSISEFDPSRVWLRVMVPPEHRHRGIGTALYDSLVSDLRARGVRWLRASTRGDQPEGLRFLEGRAYREIRRYCELELDLAGFEIAPFQSLISRLMAAGISLRSVAEEGFRDPEVRRRLWEVFRETGADEPRSDPYTPEDLPSFERSTLQDAEEVAGGWFVAREGEQYAGVASVYRSDGVPGLLRHGFTGVRRAYRGRGIATALKARVLEFGQQNGYRSVRTNNDESNSAMLKVNERLGYRRHRTWSYFERELGR